MTKKNNIITINGKQYDALTGAALSVTKSTAAPSGHNVDGVLGRSTAASAKKPTRPSAKATTKSTAAKHTTSTKRPLMDIARSPAHSIASHHPEHAKTLMRRAVHKPSQATSHTTSLKAQATLTKTAPTAITTVTPKLSLHSIDPQKQQRASTTPKSEQVNRFQSTATAQQPTESPLIQPVPHLVVQPEPVLAEATTDTAKPSLDIFERALAHATAHEQPFVAPEKRQRRASRKLRAITAATLAVIIIGGFLVYQNAASVSMYMASSKAGFQASLPNYRPSGFDLSKLTASTGVFAAKFKSTSDNRNFTLTEKPSNWDSQTLRDSYVVSVAQQSYETLQAAGVTVYVYGNDNATWVNGGVWYQLETQGALSDQQLIQIAGSI